MLLVRDIQTGDAFACKTVLCQSSEARAAIRQEVELLGSLRGHPRIAPLLDVAFERTPSGERALLLFPLYECGSTQDALAGPGPAYFSEVDVMRIALDVCSALSALLAHEPPLAHR